MIETIITSSVLILIISVLRYLLRGRISSRLQYGLWLLVVMRLVLPYSLFESPVSVMNVIPDFQRNDSIIVQPNSGNTMLPSYDAPAPQSIQEISDSTTGTTNTVDGKVTARFVWLCGMILSGVFFFISNIRFNRKLKRNRRQIDTPQSPLPVYMAASLSSPCLYGIVKPVIYLTPDSPSDGKRAAYVIAHELTHYHQKDHIWSFVRVLCLCIHWFNPLVWLAAELSRRDSELACDEGTLHRIGPENRVEYGRTLIEMMVAPSRSLDIFCCATTMTGGKGEMKERIKRIAKQPKMLITTLAVVIIVALASIACTFGGVHNITLIEAVDFSLKPLNEIKYGTLTVGNQIMDFSAAKAEEIAPFIKELRVSKKAISQSRDIDRDKNNQVHFACEGYLENGATLDIYFNFNSDFTTVWVDNGIKPSFSYAVNKPETVKEFFELQFGSITQAVEVDSAEALWKARTPYVGDNSAVSKLLGMLPLPKGLLHDHFALRTSGDERGIEWILQERDNASYSIQQLDQNALLLFALIDNLEDFYVTIDKPLDDGTAFHYTRSWADELVGGDVRDYAESPEKLQDLINFSTAETPSYSVAKLINGEIVSEYPLETEQLAEAIIMDVMVKSAAWEGIDITTLKECYLIRQMFPKANEIHEYYAYLLEDGRAVLQSGTGGRYSMLSQELYLELVDHCRQPL